MTFWFKKVPFNQRLEDADFMIEMQKRCNTMEENTLLLVYVFAFTRCIEVSQPHANFIAMLFGQSPVVKESMWNVMKHIAPNWVLQTPAAKDPWVVFSGWFWTTLLSRNDSISWRDLWIFVLFCFCSRFPEDQCIVYINIYRGFLNIPSIDPIRLSSSSFSVLLSVSHLP